LKPEDQAMRLPRHSPGGYDSRDEIARDFRRQELLDIEADIAEEDERRKAAGLLPLRCRPWVKIPVQRD